METNNTFYFRADGVWFQTKTRVVVMETMNMYSDIVTTFPR